MQLIEICSVSRHFPKTHMLKIADYRVKQLKQHPLDLYRLRRHKAAIISRLLRQAPERRYSSGCFQELTLSPKAPIQYPNRDNPSSFHGDGWEEIGDHFYVNQKLLVGMAFARASYELHAAGDCLFLNCNMSKLRQHCPKSSRLLSNGE